MSKTTHAIKSTTPEMTRLMGQQLGILLKSGMVVCLVGELGCGKTVVTQGIARGLDVPEEMAVTSPTFALIHDYPGRLPLYHADLYRLPQGIDPGDFELGDTLYGPGIVVIEWANRLRAGELDQHITLEFTMEDETTRRIRISASGQRETDLIQKLSKRLEEKLWL